MTGNPVGAGYACVSAWLSQGMQTFGPMFLKGYLRPEGKQITSKMWVELM